MEAEGILSKVDWSPWANPVVPVAKKDGTVRLCGDLKISVNPVLQAEQYPHPRIEHIFATLSGGQLFYKIDLAEAYLQMEMEEDSNVFLTITRACTAIIGLFSVSPQHRHYGKELWIRYFRVSLVPNATSMTSLSQVTVTIVTWRT